MELTLGVRKGTWTKEEDDLLRACIQQFGEGNWHMVPRRTGLNRCRKSCRIRWLNYLKPDIRRGGFGEDEVDLMIRLHRLLGNRWALISGRLPGRTPNDVKNYWNTYIRKKIPSSREEKNKKVAIKTHEIVKPQPRSFKSKSPWFRRKPILADNNNTDTNNSKATEEYTSLPYSASPHHEENPTEWFESLLNDDKGCDQDNISEEEDRFVKELAGLITPQAQNFSLLGCNFTDDSLVHNLYNGENGLDAVSFSLDDYLSTAHN